MEHKPSHPVDAHELKALADLFYRATGVPLSVVASGGSVLAESDRRKAAPPSDDPVPDKARVDAFLRCLPLLAGIGGEVALRLAGPVDRPDGRGQARPERELGESIASNMKELVLPFLDKLKKSGLSAGQVGILEVIESNLKKITSPAAAKMQSLGLTEKEIAVASLLKEGRKTREVADLLGVSVRAVEFHRYNIRKKLALDHKADLRSHLQSKT